MWYYLSVLKVWYFLILTECLFFFSKIVYTIFFLTKRCWEILLLREFAKIEGTVGNLICPFINPHENDKISHRMVDRKSVFTEKKLTRFAVFTTLLEGPDCSSSVHPFCISSMMSVSMRSSVSSSSVDHCSAFSIICDASSTPSTTSLISSPVNPKR